MLPGSPAQSSNRPAWGGARHGGRLVAWGSTAFASRWLRILSITSGCSSKVGEGPGAEVVAYEHASMFDAVSDALKPRTFCASQPGLWASKPA